MDAGADWLSSSVSQRVAKGQFHELVSEVGEWGVGRGVAELGEGGYTLSPDAIFFPNI